MPIFIVLGVVPKLTEVAKMSKKTRFVDTEYFNVIVFGTDPKCICDFLLVV